jgi:hypothetical protein
MQFIVTRARINVLLAALTLLPFSVPLFAHHGAVAYDMQKSITLKATITDFEFVNPHVQILFDTKDDNGNITHWTCEAVNPAMLTRMGWSRTTLNRGDQVTIMAHPNKKGLPIIILEKVVLANGQVLESRVAT